MSLDKIKRLREATSLAIGDCKKALEEAGGDFDKALTVLKKRGVEVLQKKKQRQASQGLIEAYIHFGGNFGALVEVNCETDFVAHTDVFKKFVKDLAMHIAAAHPLYLKKDDIPKEQLKAVPDIDEYVEAHCLFSQPFVKDTSLTIQQYLEQVISKVGENVVVRRFTRFEMGEEADEN
jgi:elongation factor Ts